jgi:hypothetical protein
MPTLDIVSATGVIPNTKISNIVIERIAGEISAPDIFFDAAIDVVANDPAFLVMGMIVIGVIGGGTESSHLNEFATESNMRKPKATPDKAAIAK